MKHEFGHTALLVGVLVFGWSPAESQQLSVPTYRSSDAAERAARVLRSISTIDRATHTLRRALVDPELGGAVWIEFEPSATRADARAATPQAAAAVFLAQYGRQVYGIGPAETSLELLAEHADGYLHHFRYAQRHGGHHVLDAQLIVHVARIDGGYVVRSANGWLFPDIIAPVLPTHTRSYAESAALSGLARASTMAAADTAPLIVPHEGGYRLAYGVRVADSTRGRIVTRYVDAQSGTVFAEATSADEEAPSSARPVRSAALLRAAPAPEPPRAKGWLVAYESGSGDDALGNAQEFVVWNTGSVYELRDNSHAGASEVRIHNLNGAGVLLDDCSNKSIVSRGSTLWGSSLAELEEVSAIHNLGESVSFWKNTFARNGMRHDSAALYGCVHGTSAGFSARYDRDSKRLLFRQDSFPHKASIAAQDVATHEFTHGVSHYEIGGTGFAGDFETIGTNEAISDYFAVRHTGEPCRAQGVWNGSQPCLRDISSDSTLSQRYANCGSDAHCVGIVISSALWATSQTPGQYYASETDHTVYHGLRYYMTPTTSFATAREIFVQAAKDRYQADSSHGLNLQAIIDSQFQIRGVALPIFVVTAGAPSGVVESGTYYLNGSASHSADSWTWDKDYSFFANGQTSTFYVPYDPGADYSIEWDLTARRTWNFDWDTGSKTTYVTLPEGFGGAPPIEGTALVRSSPALVRAPEGDPTRSNHHLGSGAWIGARPATGPPIVTQFFAFGGRRSAAGATWPNALGGERETVQHVAEARTAGLGRTVFTRLPLPAGQEAYRARFAPQTKAHVHAFVGIALDPDLGVRPGDDLLGLDAESGLVWVTDPDSGALGYLLTDVPPGARVTLRQFSTRKDAWRPDPVSDSAAYAELSAGQDALTGKVGDVRFLIGVGPVDPLAQTVDVGMVVLRAPSLAALREQAKGAPRSVLSLFAGDVAPSEGKTGIARFHLTQMPPEAGAAAGVRPISPALAPGLLPSTDAHAPPAGEAPGLRDAVRRHGITALAFAVPDGAPSQVTIRVYDPSSRLLRTLINETYEPGA